MLLNYFSPISSSRRRNIFFGLIAFFSLLYLVMFVHTPLAILVWQGYDDHLYIKLGQSFSRGNWLGEYNELTLVKGPGYPFFLAINSWLGLPVTFSHGLFYCVSLGVLSWFVLKISDSHILAFAVFVLPLFHPKFLEVIRVVRDMIYTSQFVLFFGLLGFCLFGTHTTRTQSIWAIFTGIFLGWFWLTREEGVWILPGIAFLVFFLILKNWMADEKRKILLPVVLLFGVFGLVQLIFYSGNFIMYGKFIGVDMKEQQFQSALSAMESVRVGGQKPFISVPREVREKLYTVSPSFLLLKEHLDPDGSVSIWEAGICQFHPEACGDIGTGYFLWALREAAGKAGFYESPEKASHFFAAIVEEIEVSCRNGLLHCEPNHIPYMPPVTISQLKRIPSVIGNLLDLILRPVDYSELYKFKKKITGPKFEFTSALAFLNYPVHSPMLISQPETIELAGWYYDRQEGDQWFELRVADQTNKILPFILLRNDSPDLVEAFQDRAAARQRFHIKAQCGRGCSFWFTTSKNERLEIAIDKGWDATNKFHTLGPGTFAFDLINVPTKYRFSQDVRFIAAKSMQSLLYSIYRILLPPLLISGLLAFLLSCYLVISRRGCPIVFGLAGACWLLIASRAAILVLVDISSFPGLGTAYLLPIFSLSVIAACLSLGSLVFLFRGKEDKPLIA